MSRPHRPARRPVAAALAGVAALALLAGCGRGGDPAASSAGYGTAAKPINFSILSAESQANMGPLWEPVLADLKAQTGLVMKPFFANNYSLLIEAMRAHKVQAGWFSALPSLEAARRADGEVIVRAVNGQGGAYKSVLITRKGSGVTLDRVLKCDRSLDFGLGDAKSTSGTLAPLAFLFAPRNIDPATCFKQVRSASHQANLLSVANGVLDVSTNNTVGLLFARRETPEVAGKVEVIWESPNLPEAAIVVRHGDLDAAIAGKLRDFFARYGKTPGPEQARQQHVLEQMTYSGFDPADNGYLLPVRQMEASQALSEAKRGGDKGKVAAAQAVVDALNGANPPPISPIGG